MPGYANARLMRAPRTSWSCSPAPCLAAPTPCTSTGSCSGSCTATSATRCRISSRKPDEIDDLLRLGLHRLPSANSPCSAAWPRPGRLRRRRRARTRPRLPAHRAHHHPDPARPSPPALAMPTSAELGSLRRAYPGTGAFANSAPMIFSPGLRLVPIMKPGSALPRIQAWRAAIWPFQSFRRGRTGGRTVHSTSFGQC